MKGQHWVLENIDWSVKGPWNKDRRLFGLNEFAGEITTLAMQKPGFCKLAWRIDVHVWFDYYPSVSLHQLQRERPVGVFPIFCGVGLLEALKLSYDMNFAFWDTIPEPMCIMHLHNMLVQKGLIKEPIGLYASFQELFPSEFFIDGKAPVNGFYEAFLAICHKTGSRRATFERRSFRWNALRTDEDIHGLLSPKVNRFFRRSSILGAYHDANWIPERIPDEDIDKMEDTDLVRRARSSGMTDEAMIEKASRIESISKDPQGEKMLEKVIASLPKGYEFLPPPQQQHDSGKGLVSSSEYLDLLKLDLVGCISGYHPVCALNYVWATIEIMTWFMCVEEKLKLLRNPLWVRAYENDPLMAQHKRSSFTALVLAEEDQECMEVMVNVFQEFRVGFMAHIYWEDLDSY
ncbi:hypothetical protein B7463_g12347, partial [Scytalidium lignicola]